VSVQDLKGQLSSAINNIGASELAAIEQRWRTAAQEVNAAVQGTQSGELSTAAAQLLQAADMLNQALLVSQLIAAQIQNYMATL
jgi:hypothetical protein